MNCPTCGHEIPPALILKARQSEIAKRPRKQANGEPYRRPGARGLVRHTRKAASPVKHLFACLLLFAATAYASEPLPDAPSFSSSLDGYISFEPAPKPAKKPQGFFHNKTNVALASVDVSGRLADAITTRQFMRCNCGLYERGTFYGIFSMKPIAQSDAGMVAYSLAMAAGSVYISRYLWNRSEHSQRRAFYRAASRINLALDARIWQAPITNWRILSNSKATASADKATP